MGIDGPSRIEDFGVARRFAGRFLPSLSASPNFGATECHRHVALTALIFLTLGFLAHGCPLKNATRISRVSPFLQRSALRRWPEAAGGRAGGVGDRGGAALLLRRPRLAAPRGEAPGHGGRGQGIGPVAVGRWTGG